MLKTQLHSKIFQLDPSWRDIEDVLTGDFFGTLDYLPRKTFLFDFVAHVVSLNPDVQTPCLDEIDWEDVKILFWPLTYTDEENAEPDIVIVSNKWILVIEVKLMSGLGETQPWREYVIGRKIAEDHSLPLDSVYYLLLARGRPDISRTFESDQSKQCNELLARTSYLKWHEAFFLIDSWLRTGIEGQNISAEHRRMLYDLFQAMKRRRAIAFSGFSFENTGAVFSEEERIFCPPRFIGFLQNITGSTLPDNHIFLKQEYSAFGSRFPQVPLKESFIFFDNTFKGFVNNTPKVGVPEEDLFYSEKFPGFSNHISIVKKHKHIFFEGSN